MNKPSDDIKNKYGLYHSNDAQSIQDIMKECGLSRYTVEKFTKEMVSTGKWKKVMVKRDNIIKAAYLKMKGK